MLPTHQITPCLWFDDRIEEAVKFYISVFGGEIHATSHYGEAMPQMKGKVLTIVFALKDQEFMALNGGPHFKFNEAVSFQIHCENQQEVDYFWSKLCEGGEESHCGWLKDKYGLSWQVTPNVLPQLLMDENPEKAQRAMRAMLQMRKIDIAALKAAQAA